jgi:hypothetical protein
MATWPEDLFDFAFIPDLDGQLQLLATEAEEEDWAYHFTPSDHAHPILFNYLRYTYRRLAEELKVGLSDDGQFACFNTGLVTSHQEPIFASFESNRKENAQPWFFKGWYRRGRWELNKFPELPDLAHYFDDPTCLVLDVRKDLRVNVEHIIEENRERVPDPYRSMEDFTLASLLGGAINNARERVRRSYKTAIPQYYRGQVQLLLPLCFSNPQKAELALVVEKHQTFYRATTCLTLDMAYNNARQLARPDRDWLKP